jgi:hypothetical protein
VRSAAPTTARSGASPEHGSDYETALRSRWSTDGASGHHIAWCQGKWGVADGIADDFATYDPIGGSTSTLLFYIKDGFEARATLSDGDYFLMPDYGKNLPKRFKIITGGH